MLVVLGTLMIVVFMYLVISKRTTPAVALTLVPVAFGLFAGAGADIGDMILDGIEQLAPTAALLFFAIIYFGIMIDVGLFDPLVRAILRVVRDDPMRLVVGTAVLTMVVSLDGDGSTTFIIVTSALLPLYLKLGASPVVLTVVAGLINATMNILPWGGPTARAAAALDVPVSEVFVPMVLPMVAGLIVILLFAWHLGLTERTRIGRLNSATSGGPPASHSGSVTRDRGANTASVATQKSSSTTPVLETGAFTTLDPERDTLRPRLLWVNGALTAALLVVLVMDVLPIPVLFMIATSVALILNFPRVAGQSAAIARHSSSVVPVVAMVFAAAVLTGVFAGTGMVEAMASFLIQIIPDSMGQYFAVITAVLSIPLLFVMTNDAFYFGIMPLLSQTAAQYGIEPVEMARASLVGQPLHLQSPLVASILLLVTMAGVQLADHHRRVIWRAVVVSLVLLVVGVGLGQIPLG